MITGKDYLETLRIQDETIYDNVEGMHSLECLLDDFLKENQAKHNEVLGDVSKLFREGVEVEIIGWIHGHEFEIGEKVILIEKDDGLWVSKNKDGVQWYISEEEANVC